MTLQLSSYNSLPVDLYNRQQIAAIEQNWFAKGYDSFALMQQAAWQMTQRILQGFTLADVKSSNLVKRFEHFNKKLGSSGYQPKASIWVGQGNNGGDGWLIAYYLQQAGWQVQVICVGGDNKQQNVAANTTIDDILVSSIADATKARLIALSENVCYKRFDDSLFDKANLHKADIYVDAIFGIGLDRAPKGVYEQAIMASNQGAEQNNALTVAVDIPSGLVAATGQVFEGLAVRADATLCLIARKFGLHTKDGADYSGEIVDLPLIPITKSSSSKPVATLLQSAYKLSTRHQNSYKGSYGHVLVIGGNRIDGSQGMGGATILASSSAMATGAGKITVACHDAFHGALLTSLPDAMTLDLHDKKSVKALIKDASVIAIGMGLGRDAKAQALFVDYVQEAIAQNKTMVIDADGLYHLASLSQEGHDLVARLKEHSLQYQVNLTPHSGEAARLLDIEISEVENDRLAAIKQAAKRYGGNWVLKGAGSLVLEQQQIYVCGVGNAGMATAGMGDVLSGLSAGLLAQQDLTEKAGSLRQAVLIHGMAGDVLVKRSINSCEQNAKLLIGERGLQAQDMPAAIRHVMSLLAQQYLKLN